MNAPLPPSAISPASRDALPDAWIERLFARFSAMYGSRFADLWGGCKLDQVKAVWAEELAGYGGDELRRGVEACKARDWPPTLPEFLKLCRPPVDFERAFYEAVDQLAKRDQGRDAWSHPAVYWAAVSVGNFDMTHKPWREMQARWRDALSAQLAKGEWPGVPERRDALPAPGSTMPDAERLAENIAKANAATRAANAAGDGLVWVRQPRSQEAWDEALRLATTDERVRAIVAEAVRSGVASEDGRLLRRYVG